MKTINLKGKTVKDNFLTLKSSLGGVLETKNREEIISVENNLITGYINGICYENGISHMEFDITCNEDITLVFHNEGSELIHFIYSSEGTLGHSFTFEGKRNQLNKLQTTIIGSKENSKNAFLFLAGVPYRVLFIAVSTNSKTQYSEFGNNLFNRLQTSLAELKDNTEFIYSGSYNLKIGGKLQQLSSITQEGMVRSLLMEGVINTIIALFLEQYEEDREGSENQTGSLTIKEMEAINEMSTFIKNYPDIQYTLKYLNMKTGISPSKLQEGFKLLHNRTVTDYIRNIRIEAAENLIKTTEMNISEIVYSIGLTSRSYFSKIFKEKYNCSPKYYQEHQNALAVTA